MSKKSYMDTENILSEGFFSKLINKVVPKSLKIKLTKKQIQKLEKVHKKHEKDLTNVKNKIDKLKQQSEDSLDRLTKSLEKQYGVKINKKYIEKAVNSFLGNK